VSFLKKDWWIAPVAIMLLVVVGVVGLYLERWTHTPLAHPGLTERVEALEQRAERCECGR